MGGWEGMMAQWVLWDQPFLGLGMELLRCWDGLQLGTEQVQHKEVQGALTAQRPPGTIKPHFPSRHPQRRSGELESSSSPTSPAPAPASSGTISITCGTTGGTSSTPWRASEGSRMLQPHCGCFPLFAGGAALERSWWTGC